MPSSAEKMIKIRRQIAWAGGFWFLFGIEIAVEQWLHIYSFKDQRIGGLLWLSAGGVVVMFIFIADCTDAILSRIDENLKPEAIK